MVKNTINIAHLYPKEMNIYGDTGNVLVLAKRLEWRGIKYRVTDVNPGDKIPNDTDILISGGGQDQGQTIIEKDIHTKKTQLIALANDEVPMLLVCGTYQLFGHKFITSSKKTISGIGLLDIETVAGNERLIGNIVVATRFGEIVGYENHSGKTYLGSGVEPLGKVSKGAGNNGGDGTEGAVLNNVYGTYLHGPVLPKNPNFADELLAKAIERNTGTSANLQSLQDDIEDSAKGTAITRPR